LVMILVSTKQHHSSKTSNNLVQLKEPMYEI
jgi:hypothetical protein